MLKTKYMLVYLALSESLTVKHVIILSHNIEVPRLLVICKWQNV